mgnify:CR=1 FL=1
MIGEKVSHRLAQRPGSYVILKYVRPVIKRRDTQTIHCPAAPAGVIDGSRADVSFIVSGNRAAFLPTSSAGGDRIEADWPRSVASTALG